jgi:hypothetical protein
MSSARVPSQRFSLLSFGLGERWPALPRQSATAHALADERDDRLALLEAVVTRHRLPVEQQ